MAVSKEFMSILTNSLRADLEKTYDRIEKETEMMDIVERLRFGVALDEQGDVSWCNQETMFKAADEIERLRKKVDLRESEIEWLRKKLINFQEMSNRPIIYTFTEESTKTLGEKE